MAATSQKSASARDRTADSVAAIRNTNWSFRRANTTLLTHGIHPYPARLNPAVAGRLIEALSEPGETVYDPMCGSGTVLVEARARRRAALGQDLSPFAVLLARVKATPIPAERLRPALEELRSRLRPAFEVRRLSRVGLPKFSLDMDYWFAPGVMEDLALLKREIGLVADPEEDPAAHDFYTVCFARVVRAASYQRAREFKRYRIPKDELAGHKPDVVAAFLRAADEAVRMMERYHRKCLDAGGAPVRVRVRRGDAREYVPPRPVQLEVTSPPYGDSATTVAYGQFSSLAMEWIGMNGGASQRVDKESLGGSPPSPRAKVHSEAYDAVHAAIAEGHERRAEVVRSFFYDLERCVLRMHRALEEGRHCCIVIGNRTVAGVPVPTVKIVREIAEHAGFEAAGNFSRRILFKTLPYATIPQARAGGTELVDAIGREGIVVLRKVIG